MANLTNPAQPAHIAVVIPAHNEAAHIGACLDALAVARAKLSAHSPDVRVELIVVLDSCTDATAAVVAQKNANDHAITQLTCALRCVGQVRDLGVRHAIAHGATWIACTDADSQVAPDWLVAQLAHVAEAQSMNQPAVTMICGVVGVDSWQGLQDSTRARYMAHYQDRMNHRHIHGANLSFASDAYMAVGGFAALACHEDVDLVKKFTSQGFPIVWSNRVRVITSSRLQARAEQGFAHFLQTLENTHVD